MAFRTARSSSAKAEIGSSWGLVSRGRHDCPKPYQRRSDQNDSNRRHARECTSSSEGAPFGRPSRRSWPALREGSPTIVTEGAQWLRVPRSRRVIGAPVERSETTFRELGKERVLAASSGGYGRETKSGSNGQIEAHPGEEVGNGLGNVRMPGRCMIESRDSRAGRRIDMGIGHRLEDGLTGLVRPDWSDRPGKTQVPSAPDATPTRRGLSAWGDPGGLLPPPLVMPRGEDA
jgi:hypothetical protein